MSQDTRDALIRILADGRFHSGEQLGKCLGISRAAISKQVRNLRSLGLDVFSVTGKGYRLSQALDLLQSERILGQVPGLTPDKLHLASVLDSTNQYLMTHRHHLTSGTYCLAEAQTAGRGRRGRQWHSPFGSHVYLSALWRFDCPAASLMGLSIAVGVAVAEALEQLGYTGVTLKWPNDLLYQGRKLGGILVELDGETGGPYDVVVGLGLNVQMPDSDVLPIDQPWADLAQLGAGCDRTELAVGLIRALQQMVETFELHGLEPFCDQWQRLDHYVGQPVRLLLGSREITGVERGINSQGALLLDIDGQLKPFYGGEISLRSA